MRLATIEGKRPWWNGAGAALAVAVVAGLAAAALILWLLGDPVVAGGFVAAALVLAGAGIAVVRARGSRGSAVSISYDWELMRVMAEASPDGVAITDRGGRLVCANDRYEQMFAGFPTPPSLPLAGDGAGELEVAGRMAWRDGHARVTLKGAVGAIEATITRAGQQQDVLMWRFAGRSVAPGLPARLTEALDGLLGVQLGASGVMAALITAEGNVVSANAVLRTRAAPSPDVSIIGEDLARFLVEDQGGMVRFVAEEAGGNPLRLVQIPLADDPEAPILVALVDAERGLGGGGSGDEIEALLMLMPFGVALVDREGRFLQMNSAFARAADVDPAAPPIYPGDLVVREDKSAVADAIRRFASTAARSTDLAVRLKDHPDEPVALSIAAARGLGDAAVLLSLKDNGEENRLKREVAQATKMQAVGQLAGGVAHDFNNILTAIIGHCDLMLMRHSPGDSDYDDIQQIRANSNRAASLTRQLLAFSRQQTLRPQVLQLPDVVSEVSNLLRRLMGETVTMEVKHGRDLGPVRADPGQLEQVVVNLAVNARDAMLSKGTGGKLTIQTRSVPIAEIRRRGSDIVPLGDYTALEISDTGTGIPADVLPKIFEPFFTTKEVGKGTGLGLSTVYGIVKQSGGFIFADSRPGQGATFTIYLPVHTAGVTDAVTAAAQAKQAARHRSGDLWGTGTILLVEDEDMVRAVAERALARQGYTVLAAENGEAAMELMQGVDRPTLVISDVMMPVMDGPTLARQLRKIHPDIPILFMSGYAEEQLRKSIDLDNVAFLPKPFSVQQLAEATRDVLVLQEGAPPRA
ncbi:two-component system cell cycle sensor histidine kinase/response regulator CckA [Sphingomonas sp. BE138]|uniref:response regulator n=1 Tax=Sphingomonas sp. BE138 TaxID=2817845 RepID=UPI002862A5EA|nr:response regulator [Sphingomonas sp. BE138]MDR6787997.1 two-component system cell cycle sensor histidine kinase/response regulator CckA [Sphingomonas sp. BE138]